MKKTISFLSPTQRFIKQNELDNCVQLRDGLNNRIAELESELGEARSVPARAGVSSLTPTGRKKRVMSPEARRRIQLAQQKRWAEHRRQLAQKSAPKPAAKKRTPKEASEKASSATASLKIKRNAAAGADNVDLSDITV